jgi:hypothetical protein
MKDSKFEKHAYERLYKILYMKHFYKNNLEHNT